MKIKFLALLLTLSLLGSLQENVHAQDFFNDHVDTEAPVMIPASPEAAKLGNYGNIPLNTFTGKMNYSIPLYTIEVAGKQWPISLQYNYSGLILEDKPSLMGLGWSLIANGAIVREIRGLPDEHEFGYYSPTVNPIINNYVDNGELSLDHLREKFYKGQWDSEVDKYSVNIGGIYFTFKLDENNQPVYLSHHNNQITSIIWNTHYPDQIDSFTVRDDSGVDYVFSTVERSIPPNGDEELLLNPITSWNITQIEYPNGQEINFQYTSDIFTSYDFSARGAVLQADIQEDLIDNPIFFSPVYAEYMRASSIHREILTGIDFDGGSINFNLNSGSSRDIYESIEVFNANSTKIHDYQFTHQGNRDQLTSITRNQEEFYDFEHHGYISTTPEFIGPLDKPLAQDRWKFFNAAGNSHALNIPASSYSADLDPNFNKTQQGALRKIIYPTGGYTEVIYEQNQIKTNNSANGSDYSSIPLDHTLATSLQLDGGGGTSQDKESIKTVTFNNLTVATITHNTTTDQLENTHIVLTIRRLNNSCPYGDYYPWYVIPLINATNATDQYYTAAPYFSDLIQSNNLEMDSNTPVVCPSLTFIWDPAGTGVGPASDGNNSTGRILIPPGTYEMKIYTNYNKYSNAYGEIVLKYNSAQAQDPPSPYINEDVGGLRVAELKDCPEGTDCYSTFYDYNDADGFSTGALNVVPVREVISSWSTRFYDFPDTRETNVSMYDYSTNAFTALSPDFNTPIYYKSVKVYNSQEKYNGYLETTYELPTDLQGFSYPSFPKGIDLDKGRVRNTKSYKFLSYHPNPLLGDSTAVEIVQEKDHRFKPFRDTYDIYGMDENENHPMSFKVVRRQHLNIDFTLYSYDLNPTDPVEINAVKNLYQVVGYKELDLRHKKSKDEITSYFDQGSVTQRTDYYYDYNFNDEYDQLEYQVTTDGNGDSLKIYFEYPYDHLGEATYAAMNTANQIANPVKILKLKNNDSISKQQIDFVSAGGQYLPNVIEMAKGTNSLEPRINYDYDNQGNIIKVSKFSGVASGSPSSTGNIKTLYIWGYNKMYPIAKLENMGTDNISGSTISSLHLLSALDNDRTYGVAGKEGDLRNALNNLRVLFPEALITTYTYDPMIGVTSITDPMGNTVYYEYDAQNRLIEVKDLDNKLISDYQYHLKVQN